MSGFEIAGIVLAAFPILVSTLKLYSEGAKIISKSRRNRKVLSRFALDIAVELINFEQSCSNILDDIADSAEEVVKLLGGNGWDPQLCARLEMRMGGRYGRTLYETRGRAFRGSFHPL